MSIVFIDLETTGLDSEKDHITEVGAVKTNDYGDVIAVFHSLVRLPEGVKVPEFITELTGITDKMLSDEGKAAGDVMNDLHEFIEDSLVVAQYAPFDLGFIEHFFPVKHFYDTRTMAYALKHEKAGLKDLTARYGVELPEHHRATGDAKACAEVFFHLVDELGADATSELLNVVGTRPERMPKVYPKNTVAVVDYALEKEDD